MSETNTELFKYWNAYLFDVEELFETNIAAFLTVAVNTFSAEGRKMAVSPSIVTQFVDIVDQRIDCGILIHSIVEVLKAATPTTISGNDYTVVDMAAVEINDNKMSSAKNIIIATKQSFENIVQWHILNKTDVQFKNLFFPLYVMDYLLAEDEFIVIKYFEPHENLRPLCIDMQDDKLRIAVSPHIKARVRRVRRSIIAQSQENFFIDHRYNAGENK